MAGLAGHALAVSGATVAIAAFLTAALTMSALMFLLSVTIARAQDSLVGQLRANTGKIKIWGGRILIMVGAWLIALAIWSDFFVEVLAI